jgi:hypothetical protein
MNSNFFTNSFFRIFAIIGLSFFSIKTTTFGFTQYLAGQRPFAIITSISVQVVIVAACFILTNTNFNKIIRIGSFLLYLLALTISVSGSFLEFDNWMCRSDREERNTSILKTAVIKYKSQAINSIDNRITLIEKELKRLEKVMKDEKEVGIASHNGAGEGPMYRTLGSLYPSLYSLKKRFIEPLEKIKSYNLSEDNRVDLFNDLQFIASVLAATPSDQTIMDEIDVFYKLLSRTKYGDIYNVPEINNSFPKIPDVKVLRRGSSEELFAGSFNDLKAGYPTSIMALIGAIIIDLLILLLTVVDSMFNVKDRIDHNGFNNKYYKNQSYLAKQNPDWVLELDNISTNRIANEDVN